MKNTLLVNVGILFVFVGIISFLLESISHWITLVILLVGAVAVVKGAWFS